MTNDQRMVDVELLEVLTKAFSQQVRAFRNTTTGEVKHVLLNSECDDPSWEDVVVLPDVSNEDQDKLRAIIDGPGVEPVATVADAYDCNGLHWHCEQPPEDGALLYLAAPSAPVAKCAECGKQAGEGWALYCVECAGKVAPVQAVPDGWQLINRTPTPEQRELLLCADEFTTGEMWIMLLAAAPQPPKEIGE